MNKTLLNSDNNIRGKNVRFLKISILFLLSMLLAGCLYKSPARHDSAYDTLLSKINAEGVFIKKNNKAIIFKIPNDVFFKQNSVNFNTEAYEILELILDFSNYCKIDEIVIIDYGKNKPITAGRAHKIGEYLWYTRANTNFVYSYSNNNKHNNKDDCIMIKYSLI